MVRRHRKTKDGRQLFVNLSFFAIFNTYVSRLLDNPLLYSTCSFKKTQLFYVPRADIYVRDDLYHGRYKISLINAHRVACGIALLLAS